MGVEAVAGWHRRPVGGGVRFDVRDRDAVADVVRTTRPDAIVHCAYVYGGVELSDVTAHGAGRVAEVAADAGLRLVHVSSDVVFDGTTTGRYREADPVGPVTPYAAAKVEAESLVARAHPGATIARSALVVGGAMQNPQRQLVVDALAGTRDTTFFSDVVRTPVGVTDLARALVELAAIEVAGPVHLGGEEAVTRAELAAAIAVALGASAADLRTGPAPPGVGPLRVPLDSSLASTLLSTALRGVSDLDLAS